MSLDNPIPYFLQAAQAKNQNRQQLLENIAGLGQGIGSLGGTVGQLVAKKRMQDLLKQSYQAGPVQGPTLPGAGMPNMPMPKSGTGSPFNPPDPGQLLSAYTKVDPQGSSELVSKMIQQRMGLLNKQASPWRVVPGMLSKEGKPIQQNEITGEVREAAVDATPTGRGNSAYGAASITWDNATPEDKDLAIGIAEGRIRPFDLGTRDRTVAVRLAAEASKRLGMAPFESFYGNVREKMAESLSSGKLGMNALSLNTALGHANSAMDAYKRVENTNQKWLNMPLNVIRKETNNPNIVKLQTTLNALSGELATVFKGSAGTDQEIGHWIDVLSQDLTPRQALGAIQQVNDLLRSRLDALRYQQTDVMERRPGQRNLLSPHAADLQSRIGTGSNNQDLSTMSDAELQQLAAGGR